MQSSSALGLRNSFSAYKELSKSGIVALVLISVLGGYLSGHPGETPLDGTRLLITLFGVLLLASGSSALNQLQEHEIDSRMPRTAKRPLPSGRITIRNAATFIALSLAAGLALLAWISIPVLLLGIAAVLSYNVLYTLWWKRHWAYAAVPGAIPGALPILMGYAAASGRILAPAGIYLFLILFYWQMPHFWVLALRFREDYARGDFPTLPVARGEKVTILQIAVWGVSYVALSLLAPLFLGVGKIYVGIAVPTCLILLWELRGFVRDAGVPGSKGWLKFFLWVNFSLILFVGAAALDLWSHHLFGSLWTR